MKNIYSKFSRVKSWHKKVPNLDQSSTHPGQNCSLPYIFNIDLDLGRNPDL